MSILQQCGQRLSRKVIKGAESVTAMRIQYKQVGQLLCERMSRLLEHTVSAAKWPQHCSNSLGRRGQLWRGPRPPWSILFSARWYEVANENSFQTAIPHAFPQPSAAWEPGKREKPVQFNSIYLVLIHIKRCLMIFNRKSQTRKIRETQHSHMSEHKNFLEAWTCWKNLLPANLRVSNKPLDQL